tara:strand:+ start:2421 stop:2627 length:207 start_codon:yes stop_codon:yes gene_type:complete
MERSLLEVYQRMELLLSTVPEGVNINKDKDAGKTIYNVMAMEEEWIVDPDLRDELTLVQLTPNEDNTT